QSGFGLRELLIQLWSIDLRQYLAALNVIANGDEPPLEVAVDASVNRCFLHGLNAAGQQQIGGSGRAYGKSYRNRGNRLFALIHRGAQLALPPEPGRQTDCRKHDEPNERYD